MTDAVVESADCSSTFHTAWSRTVFTRMLAAEGCPVPRTPAGTRPAAPTVYPQAHGDQPVLGVDGAAGPAAANAGLNHHCGRTALGGLPPMSAPPSATLPGTTTRRAERQWGHRHRAGHVTAACLAPGAAGEESRMTGHRSGWTVGPDQIAARDWSGALVETSSGGCMRSATPA